MFSMRKNPCSVTLRDRDLLERVQLLCSYKASKVMSKSEIIELLLKAKLTELEPDQAA